MLVIVDEVRTLLLVVIPHYVRRVRRYPAHLLGLCWWLMLYRRRVGQEGHVGSGRDGAAAKPGPGEAVD